MSDRYLVVGRDCKQWELIGFLSRLRRAPMAKKENPNVHGRWLQLCSMGTY